MSDTYCGRPWEDLDTRSMPTARMLVREVKGLREVDKTFAAFDLAVRVERVLALHERGINPQGLAFCKECVRIGWPCPTVRALDGEA